MSTTFPPGLPRVEDDWDVELRAGGGRIEPPADPGEGYAHAVTEFFVRATSKQEAELRVLAYVCHAQGELAFGSVATAEHTSTPGRYVVTLRVPGES